jgi:hypothetical protein
MRMTTRNFFVTHQRMNSEIEHRRTSSESNFAVETVVASIRQRITIGIGKSDRSLQSDFPNVRRLEAARIRLHLEAHVDIPHDRWSKSESSSTFFSCQSDGVLTP